LGAVIAAQRLPGSTTSVGGGADVLLDRAQPTYELRDYERLTATSEAFIYVAMSRLMVKRLARS
jgi:hypothetical protein